MPGRVAIQLIRVHSSSAQFFQDVIPSRSRSIWTRTPGAVFRQAHFGTPTPQATTGGWRTGISSPIGYFGHVVATCDDAQCQPKLETSDPHILSSPLRSRNQSASLFAHLFHLCHPTNRPHIGHGHGLKFFLFATFTLSEQSVVSGLASRSCPGPV